jgi:Putative peptidoglycan binding domain
VPRQIDDDDDDMPRRRRRRSAAAVALEADSERGLAMRILLHSPKDMVAGALAFAAVSAIIANALLLQAGPHPSPMFGSVVALPAVATPVSPLPRPRPVEAAKVVDAPVPEMKPAEPKANDPLGNLVKATSAPAAVPSNIPRPPAPIPSHAEAMATPASGSRRVAAVQRTLTEYGYGQLKPTGTVGSDTQAAIQKFERERKIPVTGQMSDRLVRELTAMVGHPID